MTARELVASTQYGDARGTSAIDWYDSMNAFAEACGVDKDQFFPVAVEFYSGEGSETVNFYAVDCRVTGSTADEIAAYAQNHNNALPVRKLDTEASLSDLIQFAKRFSVVAINQLVPPGCRFEVK